MRGLAPQRREALVGAEDRVDERHQCHHSPGLRQREEGERDSERCFAGCGREPVLDRLARKRSERCRCVESDDRALKARVERESDGCERNEWYEITGKLERARRSAGVFVGEPTARNRDGEDARVK
jgi:hypothetical protein